MPFDENAAAMPNADQQPTNAHWAIFIFGLVAPMLTFLLAVSPLAYEVKIGVLVGLSAVYLVVCVWAYRQMKQSRMVTAPSGQSAREARKHSELRQKMVALEEANQFFGASIKPSDMFRLVSSRVREIFPFSTSILLVPDEEGLGFTAAHADGEGASKFIGVKIDAGSGLAGMAALSRENSIDPDLSLDGQSFGAELTNGFKSSAAIPLIHDGGVFGVFQLFRNEKTDPAGETEGILNALAERLTPLFLSSLAFERSLSNALTDRLTNLPNERAFFMVLENQLAESQRFRDERPLTVLVMDIQGFAEANNSFGHATGDKILGFVGEIIQSQLRKMDFLARTTNDEFVAVLPTASEKTTIEIIERIRSEFAGTPFVISEHEMVKIWLSFGWATFWQDGETAKQLLFNAQIRKQQSKSEDVHKVVFFPKEYVN
jgi:diguanylate cyclase (GGDEF)-like protein